MNNLFNIIKDCKYIEWNASLSNENTLLVYVSSKLDSQAEELAYERLLNAKYKVLITNLKLELKNTYTLEENELYEVIKDMCDYLLPLPNIKSIAITGTNGKTTTVDIIRQILIAEKKGVLTIGTMGVWKNEEKVEDYKLTSPHYIDFRKSINRYLKPGEYLIVESSSHAILQRRQFKYNFDAIGFTSFSQDHLDYHETMDDYLAAKLNLQNQSSTKFIISKKANELKLLDFPKDEFNYTEKLTNDFLNVVYNKINLDVALGCLERIGINPTKKKLEDIKQVPGRFNIIKNKKQVFVIDFAHTPDSLENILKSIQETYPGKHVVTIFGCGGNRDKLKRPLMGKIAEKNSDYLLITSDNPRDEKPETIIEDIVKGLDSKNIKVEVDRKLAINYAYKNFPESVILIAGKGHEEYIEQNGIRTYYSDIQVVSECINVNKK